MPAAIVDDFIGTIDSDDESIDLSEPGPSTPRNSKQKKQQYAAKPSRTPVTEAADEVALDPDFAFDVDGGRDALGGVNWERDLVQGADSKGNGISVDDIIARRTGKPPQSYQDRKRKRQDREEDSDEEGSEAAASDEDEDEDGEDIEMDGESEVDEDGFGMGVVEEEEDSDEGDDDEMDVDGEDEQDSGSNDEEDDDVAEDGVNSDSSSDEEEETAEQLARKEAFFGTDPTASASASTSNNKQLATDTSFSQMSLSRPILRALTSLSLNNPTPIQQKAIPLALLGRDILGSAVTGSGKTMAFMVPILERLSYRDRGKGGKASGMACRVLILCPTRELAVQCEAVGKSLVERGGLDIRFALLVGGLSVSAQAHTLRTLPDILIATPGRLIDHLNNSPSFTLSALDILVIDEADRMLEVGFEAELNEIIKSCPRTRQTMLFSATMTDSVDELVKLSLDRPVRVFVDPKRSTSKNLVQEFVRVRERGSVVGGAGAKGEDRVRAACLLSLCKRTVREKCIIFFRSKALAHQMRIVFGLCGMKAAELHGNLTQEQRLHALQEFKNGQVDYLLATDLASRGLDIKGVETVINYDMPGQLSQYTHRVGRTARAGRNGRSITLVGEADRKMLKAAIKQSTNDQIRHRVIPTEAISETAEELENLRSEVSEVLKEEKEEKALRQADMEVRKGQNMIEHEAEIFSRPARTWFQSEKEKKKAQDASKAQYLSGVPTAGKDKEKAAEGNKIKRGKYEGLSRKQTRRKLARELDEEIGDTGAVKASIRAAKKAGRPVKITEPERKQANKKRKLDKKPKKRVGAGGFDQDAGKKGSAAREGMRAGRSDGVGMGGKKKGGAKGGGKKRR